MTINFTGEANKSLRDGGRHDFDIVNKWSIVVWLKPNATPGDIQTVFHLNDSDRGDTDNTIRLDVQGQKVRTLLTGSLGYYHPAKFHSYEGVVTSGQWTNLVWTWDNTTSKLYVDGTFMSPSGTLTNDNNVIQTDSVDKSLWIAENKDTFDQEFDGRIHSAAIFRGVISTATISGIAADSLLDLNAEGAKHWWPMTIISGSIVVDSGTSSNLVELSSFVVSGTDEVVDVP